MSVEGTRSCPLRRELLRYSLTGAAALAGGTVLSSCSTTEPGGGGEGGAATSLQQRVDQGLAVRLAVADEPPYTVLQPNGEITGAAPDVAKAVLARLGITEVEAIQTDYNTMVPGLRAGRWDMVTAGLFMDEERCAAVLYSAPVLVSTESFAVPPGNPESILSINSVIQKPELTIAVLGGSYELCTATNLGVPESQLQTYPLAPDAIAALAAGRVGAVLLPTLTLKQLKEQQGGNFDVTPSLDEIPKTGSGAAFRDSDQEFHSRYNPELVAFKATPEFAEILTQWGFDPEAARSATREELCAVPA
ncbi:MAG: ectoine/hydroxyectoine ABC transporter substrate-binding protein EhuB [Pseudonocardia sp.]|nr:ectoine/hydroxyectoine ABC transporter substrate-binding protein EhuB [Pseudonocardia sp.]